MSQYQKECNRCGEKIKMSDQLGKWKAFDLEGKNIHECKPKQETSGHEGFCTKWHESYKVLNPYWKCCPYCSYNLEHNQK